MIYGIISSVNLLFQIYTFLVFAEVIGSWVTAARVRLPDWGYNILRLVHNLTEPVLGPIRRLIPSVVGLDISPIIALVLLDVLRRLIVSALLGLR